MGTIIISKKEHLSYKFKNLDLAFEIDTLALQNFSFFGYYPTVNDYSHMLNKRVNPFRFTEGL